MDDNFIRIDFSEMKFNLYDTLGVEKTTSMKNIKRAYRKLVLLHHPDRNKDADEEIFNQITMSYQILSNKIYRKKYNKWLKSQLNNQVEYKTLKQKWLEERKEIDKLLPKQNHKEEYLKTFSQLEEKHKEKVDKKFMEEDKLEERMKKMNEERNEFKIEKEEFNDFNGEFNMRKKKKVDSHEIIKLNNEIISYDQAGTCEYTSLENMNKLYLEDENLLSNNFSSLNCAFSMHQYDEFEENNLTLEERIKLHQEEREKLKNMAHTEYKEEKF